MEISKFYKTTNGYVMARRTMECTVCMDPSYGDVKIYQAIDDVSIWMAIISRLYYSEVDFLQGFTKYKNIAKLNEIPGMVQLYEIA
jgi:hypothetical protein